MGCDELRRLLVTNWRDDESMSRCIATHIRICRNCHHGLVHLKDALVGSDDALTCDQCRATFPTYYEATRPAYPLVEMADKEMARVAFHLSQCDTCHEEYEVLLLLAELEERDEMVDL